MVKKYKKGRIYYIKFEDHHVGSELIDYCEVVGFFHKKIGSSLELFYWRTFIKGEIDLANNEILRVVESTILDSYEISHPKLSKE